MADLQIHAPLAIAAGVVFIPVDTVMVGLRIYARKLQGVRLGPDDWTIIGALVFVVGMAATFIAEVAQKRLGYASTESSTVEGQPDANIAFWPLELLSIPALGLIKMSFIFFYRRIFSKGSSPVFNLVTWFMLFVVFAWTISFFFSIVFICRTNFSSYWASTIVEKADCVDTNVLHNALAISDFILDIVILVLPVPLIWRLHLTVGRKLGVMAIFLLGALAVAMSAVRLAIFVQATSVNYDPNIDFEYLCTNGIYWSMLEVGVGVIAACLPSQYVFVNNEGVQKMVKSARSVVSLSSFRGSVSRRSSRINTPRSPVGGTAHSSETNIKAFTPDTSRHGSQIGGIVVTHSFENKIEEV